MKWLSEPSTKSKVLKIKVSQGLDIKREIDFHRGPGLSSCFCQFEGKESGSNFAFFWGKWFIVIILANIYLHIT